MIRRACTIGVLVLLLPASALRAQERTANLVTNGDFERGTDGWQTSGDPATVKQTLRPDTGRDGRRCIRLDCTAFEGGKSWRHAMLCQVDRVKVRKGRLYTLDFWAKGKDVKDYVVNVALQDTDGWHKLGLNTSFVPTKAWKRFTFQFVALRDCSRRSRLQFWFNSTGTIWVDDVVMTEGKFVGGTGLARPAKPLTWEGRKNPLPNASFECGPDGWAATSPTISAGPRR